MKTSPLNPRTTLMKTCHAETQTGWSGRCSDHKLETIWRSSLSGSDQAPGGMPLPTTIVLIRLVWIDARAQIQLKFLCHSLLYSILKAPPVHGELSAPKEFSCWWGFAFFLAVANNVEKVRFGVSSKIQHLLWLFLLLLFFPLLPHFLSV